MNILVCIKQVPDTETRIRIPDGGSWIDESGVTFVLSPFDEFAVEEALRLREARGGEVVVIGAGPERAAQALRTALAMGADRAIHVKDDRVERADSLTIARLLAAAAAGAGTAFDLVLLGKLGVGTDNAQVGPMLAELLGLPQVTGVSKLEIGEGTLVAHREIEGAVEIVESSLPAVVTAEKGLNEPRYPSLKGIMAAKKKPMDTVEPAALGVAIPAAGGEPVRWTGLAAPAARGAGKIFTGDAGDAARQVAHLLREEAKVI